MQFSADLPTKSYAPDRPYRTQPWHLEYMAALFEPDRNLMAERIRRAELTILAREHQLYIDRSDPEEQRALNNALHALGALRACMGL